MSYSRAHPHHAPVTWLAVGLLERCGVRSGRAGPSACLAGARALGAAHRARIRASTPAPRGFPQHSRSVPGGWVLQVTLHNSALLDHAADAAGAAGALGHLLASQELDSCDVRAALAPALPNLLLVLLGAGELGATAALLAEHRAHSGSERVPQVLVQTSYASVLCGRCILRLVLVYRHSMAALQSPPCTASCPRWLPTMDTRICGRYSHPGQQAVFAHNAFCIKLMRCQLHSALLGVLGAHRTWPTSWMRWRPSAQRLIGRWPRWPPWRHASRRRCLGARARCKTGTPWVGARRRGLSWPPMTQH